MQKTLITLMRLLPRWRVAACGRATPSVPRRPTGDVGLSVPARRGPPA